MAMRQMMLGRQGACTCVSVDSSHEKCTYHILKYSCKFNGIQRPFLLYMNLRVVFFFLGGGRLIIGVGLYSGKYGPPKNFSGEARSYKPHLFLVRVPL